MRDYCRLCACKNYNNLCLFGTNDDPNEIYKAVELYFTSVFLNLAWAKPFRWICHQCCKCIMEFKMFQEFVGKSQKKLMAVAEAKQGRRKRKANIQNDKPNVINSQNVETLPQGFNNDPTNIPIPGVCSMPCKIAEPSTAMPVTYNMDYPIIPTQGVATINILF
uniref:ZAD domain-containing protein n=1 Tax=Musca domestica TaxID=7370 RepID=A0A1I8NFG7_MUSDO